MPSKKVSVHRTPSKTLIYKEGLQTSFYIQKIFKRASVHKRPFEEILYPKDLRRSIYRGPSKELLRIGVLLNRSIHTRNSKKLLHSEGHLDDLLKSF